MIRIQKVFSLCLMLSITILLSAQNVSNVVVQQSGDKIEVSYSLDKEADTYLCVVVDGKFHFCRYTSGDVGENISAGRRTITWDVLSDMDEFVGEAVFEVHASQSTRAKQAIVAKQQKEEAHAEKMKEIYPLAGFDVNGGAYGLGGSIYWPWVINRPSRVGSYFSYVYGMKGWKDESLDSFHNLCLGLTITVSKHVALFAAPGFSVLNYKYEHQTVTKSSYSSYAYTSTTYTNERKYKFAVEGGICFKLLIFTLSAKFAYPSYFGVGLGLDFGWLN